MGRRLKRYGRNRVKPELGRQVVARGTPPLPTLASIAQPAPGESARLKQRPVSFEIEPRGFTPRQLSTYVRSERDFESPSLLVLECHRVVGSDRGPATTCRQTGRS